VLEADDQVKLPLGTTVFYAERVGTARPETPELPPESAGYNGAVVDGHDPIAWREAARSGPGRVDTSDDGHTEMLLRHPTHIFDRSAETNKDRQRQAENAEDHAAKDCDEPQEPAWPPRQTRGSRASVSHVVL